MKLKSLKVENFRGLCGEENIINFDNSDVIFLIGKNNNGKSTFLRAYDFFVTPKSEAKKDDFFNGCDNKEIKIYVEFLIEEGNTYTDIVEKDKNKSKSDDNDYPNWIEKWCDDDKIIRIMKKWTTVGQKAGDKYTYNPKTEKYEKNGFGGIETILKKYAPTPIIINAIYTIDELEKNINEIIAKEHLKEIASKYSQEYANIVDSVNELKNKISNSDDITKINDKMNNFFKNVFSNLELNIYSDQEKVVDISKSLKSEYGIEVHGNQRDSESRDLKLNGHGIIRQAFFSFLSTHKFDVNKTKKEYLILFEEPELYLHPISIYSLRENLYNISENSPFQILCATHSPTLIDISKEHSSLVRLVKNKDNITKTVQVEFDIFKDEDKNRVQMINRFNPHICESFYSELVILVEGDTEAIIYRELLEKFYKEENDKKDIYVLNTGSKANMVFYIKILSHFHINHVVVHDIDKEHSSNGNTNPMWTYNNTIWKAVEENYEFSRRYLHCIDFESSHNYIIDNGIGKPLSAYNFVSK